MDPKDRRGNRRRLVLKTIVQNEGLPQLELSRRVYGDSKGRSSYRGLLSVLSTLKKFDLIRIDKETSLRRIYSTELGRELYKKEEMDVFSKDVSEFIKILNGKILKNPITPDQETQLYNLLSDDVLEILLIISDDLPLLPPEKYQKIESLYNAWRILRGVWVYEMQLREPKYGGFREVEYRTELDKLLSKKYHSEEEREKARDSLDKKFPLRTGVYLVDSENLGPTFSKIRRLFFDIAKDPRLAALRDHVRIAYTQHRAYFQQDKRRRG